MCLGQAVISHAAHELLINQWLSIGHGPSNELAHEHRNQALKHLEYVGFEAGVPSGLTTAAVVVVT